MKTSSAILLVACISLQAGPKHTFLPVPPTPAGGAAADVLRTTNDLSLKPAAEAQAALPVAAQNETPPATPAIEQPNPLPEATPGPAAPAVPTFPAGGGAMPPAGPTRDNPAEASLAIPGAGAGPVASPAAEPVVLPGAPGAQPAKNPVPIPRPKVEEPATNTFNFPSIDINTFLNFYAELVGRTILRPANLPAPLITLKTQTPLTRTEAIQAFDTVLAMNGITMINVGEKFVKAVPFGQAAQEAAQFSKVEAGELPESAQYVTYMVQLKYVKPSEVLPVLQPFSRIPNSILAVESSQMLVIRDYSENVKRMLEMLKEIDVMVPAEFISEVIPIKYALATEIASALSSLSTGGGATSVGAARTGTAGAATRRTTAPGFPTAPGMGVPGATPFGAQPAAAAQPAQPSFSDRLRSIIQKAAASGEFQIIGPNKIIADERTNSLLVFASRQDMEMIKEIVSKLDVVLAQVLIEAVILEVSVGDSLNYGVSWLKRPETTGKFSQAAVIQNNPSFRDPNSLGGALGTNVLGTFASGLSWWGRYNDDFDVAVQAAAEDSRVRVVSRPRIQTSHAVPAAITIGISRPIITGTYNYYGGPQTQFQYQNFGITLNVTPLINPDGLVVMDIDQQIQNVGREIKVDANFTMPEVTTRSANAKVAVRNRDTIMLGGFISSQVSGSKSGVPLLKDIPLLGHLFSGVTRRNDRSELIVLIRPTVLPTPEFAAQNAKEEQARMPLVKRASQAEQKETEKQLKRIDKSHVFEEIEPKP